MPLVYILCAGWFLISVIFSVMTAYENFLSGGVWSAVDVDSACLVVSLIWIAVVGATHLLAKTPQEYSDLQHHRREIRMRYLESLLPAALTPFYSAYRYWGAESPNLWDVWAALPIAAVLLSGLALLVVDYFRLRRRYQEAANYSGPAGLYGIPGIPRRSG